MAKNATSLLRVVVKDLQLSPGETKDLGALSVKRPSN
jgi:hypothetical protein